MPNAVSPEGSGTPLTAAEQLGNYLQQGPGSGSGTYVNPGSGQNSTSHSSPIQPKQPSSQPSGTTTSKTGAKPVGGNHVVTMGGYDYIVDANGNIVSVVGPHGSGSQAPNLNLTGGGSGGGMTAYEAAQVALDKQKLANAQAQQQADEQYRQAQALDTFNKNFQDFQTKHYYGSIAGPAYAAPAGAPNWWKMPEPDYVANSYKNNPNAGSDPWNQPNPYSGYSGSLYSNPQQPGQQNTPPSGALAAPVAAAGQGQAVNGPTPGATSGALPSFNPNAPQSGQNVLTPPPIAPPKSMAMGGQSAGTQLAVVHGGEELVEPGTIGATGVPVRQRPPFPDLYGAPSNPGSSIPGYAEGKVPGPPGQPQLAMLDQGEGVIPGGNFSDNNPSPVANAGPESMNPLIKQLLSAINGIMTSPEFQSAVYSPNGGTAKPPLGPPGSDSQPGDDSTPGSFATGRAVPPPLITPPPIAASRAAQMSGVIAGPMASNHVPYGPELTGLSGYGGLITPNGTPVVASEWQRQHLNPTSLANYDDYAGSIAGFNPADLKQASDTMTGALNENSPTIKAPTRFDLSGQLPAPISGGG